MLPRTAVLSTFLLLWVAVTHAFLLSQDQRPTGGSLRLYYVTHRSSSFTPSLPSTAPYLPFVMATPFDACTSVSGVNDSIAFVIRGGKETPEGCSFFTKVLNAQLAGARGVVVADNRNSNPAYPVMVAGSNDNTSLITIGAVLISYSDSSKLQNPPFSTSLLNVSLVSVGEYNDDDWRLPSVSLSGLVVGVVVTCSTLLLCIIVYRIYYARRAYRLMQQMAAHIQLHPAVPARPPIQLRVVKFSKPAADEAPMCINESCAICLDEFNPDDELNVLDCRHGFHARCLEPWLNRPHQYDCPMCRSNVGDDLEGPRSSSGRSRAGSVASASGVGSVGGAGDSRGSANGDSAASLVPQQLSNEEQAVQDRV